MDVVPLRIKFHKLLIWVPILAAEGPYSMKSWVPIGSLFSSMRVPISLGSSAPVWTSHSSSPRPDQAAQMKPVSIFGKLIRANLGLLARAARLLRNFGESTELSLLPPVEKDKDKYWFWKILAMQSKTKGWGWLGMKITWRWAHSCETFPSPRSSLILLCQEFRVSLTIWPIDEDESV